LLLNKNKNPKILILILETKHKTKLKMNYNLLFETILILFAILASNGILYSLTFFNKPNSSENISVIRNSSEKDGLAFTSLIASNPISITSSNSSSSETLSVTSSSSNSSETLSVTSLNSNSSETLSVTSSDTYVSWDTFDSIEEIEGTPIGNLDLSNTIEEILPSNVDVIENFSSEDSLTILDTQSFEQWWELAMELHAHPINTPAGILQQIKFEELNIIYSQDIIHYGISQTDLRIIIDLIPAINLFDPGINHFFLTIMSCYHF